MPASYHTYLQALPPSQTRQIFLQEPGCFIPSWEFGAFNDVLPNDYLSLTL